MKIDYIDQQHNDYIKQIVDAQLQQRDSSTNTMWHNKAISSYALKQAITNTTGIKKWYHHMPIKKL